MEADPGDELDVLAVADDQIHLLVEGPRLFRIDQQFQLEPLVLQQFLNFIAKSFRLAFNSFRLSLSRLYKINKDFLGI